MSNYNTLRTEVDTLRHEYKALQRENMTRKTHSSAELQLLLASEVTLALGLKRTVDSSSDFVRMKGSWYPPSGESIDEYNWLKSGEFVPPPAQLSPSLAKKHHTCDLAWSTAGYRVITAARSRIRSRVKEHFIVAPGQYRRCPRDFGPLERGRSGGARRVGFGQLTASWS